MSRVAFAALSLSRVLSLSLFLPAHLFLFSICSAVLSLGFSLSGNEELWVQSVLEMPKRRDILAIVLIVLPWTLLITVWHQSTIAPLLAVHKGERNQTSPCQVCASLPRPHLSHFISPWQPFPSQLPVHAHAEASPLLLQEQLCAFQGSLETSTSKPRDVLPTLGELCPTYIQIQWKVLLFIPQ